MPQDNHHKWGKGDKKAKKFTEEYESLKASYAAEEILSQVTKEELEAYLKHGGGPTNHSRECQCSKCMLWFTRNAHEAPCECNACSPQFRKLELQANLAEAYDAELAESEAIAYAANRMENIQKNFAYLRKMYGAHSKTMSARWRKKSPDKREAFMRQAYPGIEPKQSKEIGYMVLQGVFDWRTARSERETWLHTWLNIEALKHDPMRLIGLLQNRAKFSPEEWAPFDMANLMFPYHQGLLAINYSKLCFKMYGKDYGQLVPWEKEAAHRFDIVGFPRGQLILDCQDSVLLFCCNAVKMLCEGLEEIPETIDRPNFIPDIPNFDQKRSGCTELWSRYTNQPFSEPSTFDINSLMSISQATLNSYSDHLWLMQTDPAYLRKTVRTIISAMPVGRTTHATAVREIQSDVGSYLSWVWVVDMIKRVRDLLLKYSDDIQKGKPLPAELDMALQGLEMLMVTQMKTKQESLQASLPRRVGFSDLFETEYSKVHFKWKLKVGHQTDPLCDGLFYKYDPLFWCISNLSTHPPERLAYPPNMLFSWLDEFLATAPLEEKRRIDERLREALSEYAVQNEILNTVQLHRPYMGKLPKFEIGKACSVFSAAFRFPKGEELDPKLRQKVSKTYSDIPEILRDFCLAYDEGAEVGKKTDQRRLKRFDSIQKAQDLLWTRLRSSQTTLYQNISEEDLKAHVAAFSARLEPKFLQALAAERQELVDRIERSSKPVKHAQPETLAPWHFSSDSKAGSSGTKISSTSTTKVKSRPEPLTPLQIPVPAKDSEQNIESSLTPIQVKPQTYTILSSMFTSTNSGAAGKKLIDWVDFMNAMSDRDVGFCIRHSGGSAHTFEIDDQDRKWIGKILFHRPHPDAKIDRVIFRGWGRRMEKWFGWNQKTFIVKT